MQEADFYLTNIIKKSYPEVVIAIQQRRATRQVINHQKGFIDNICDLGLIQDKESHLLTKNIKKKLMEYKMKVPKINIAAIKQKILVESDIT